MASMMALLEFLIHTYLLTFNFIYYTFIFLLYPITYIYISLFYYHLYIKYICFIIYAHKYDLLTIHKYQ